jgi:hypothetical protein
MIKYTIQTPKNKDGFWNIPSVLKIQKNYSPIISEQVLNQNYLKEILEVGYAILIMMFEQENFPIFVIFRNDSIYIETDSDVHIYHYKHFTLFDYTLYKIDKSGDLEKLERFKKIKTLLC